MLLQIKQQNIVLDTKDQFVIETDTQKSYLSYRIVDQTLDLYCAYVPENLRGNGHASSLILFALQFAVLNGLWVKANCAAVRAYIKMYPEWRYIIAK
jgi:predicted GNAT family acetyltransferase